MDFEYIFTLCFTVGVIVVLPIAHSAASSTKQSMEQLSRQRAEARAFSDRCQADPGWPAKVRDAEAAKIRRSEPWPARRVDAPRQQYVA